MTPKEASNKLDGKESVKTVKRAKKKIVPIDTGAKTMRNVFIFIVVSVILIVFHFWRVSHVYTQGYLDGVQSVK